MGQGFLRSPELQDSLVIGGVLKIGEKFLRSLELQHSLVIMGCFEDLRKKMLRIRPGVRSMMLHVPHARYDYMASVYIICEVSDTGCNV